MNIIDNEPLHTFTHIYTFDYEFFWSNIGQIRFSKLGKPYFKPLFSLMTSSSGGASALFLTLTNPYKPLFFGLSSLSHSFILLANLLPKSSQKVVFPSKK